MDGHYTLTNESETKNLACAIADTLHGGQVIGLIGELGTGKTTFTQHLAEALGVEEHVTSPTFTIMQIYEVDAKPITRLVHIDAYRLAGTSDLHALGAEEHFSNPNTVTVIEWADRVRELVPPHSLLLHFTHDQTTRTVTVQTLA